MLTKKTDLELLNITISMTTKTDTAFAKKIGMTRQNLNRIKRMSELNKGELPNAFKLKLKKMYDVDIYEYQTLNKESENVLEEDETDYKAKYIELLEKTLDEKDAHIRILENKIPQISDKKKYSG